MTSMEKAVTAIALVALALLVAFCFVVYRMFGPWPLSPYPVTDSNVWVAEDQARRVYWLDDSRILFLTGEDFRILGDHETGYRPGRRRSLAIWELGKAPALYRRDVKRLRCYVDGVIWYLAYGPHGETQEWRGPLGAERPYHRAEPGYVAETAFRCRYIDNRIRNQPDGARRLLLPRHGYLALGSSNDRVPIPNSPVSYTPPGAAAAVTLPFGRREISQVEYYEFADAYLLYGYRYEFRERRTFYDWPDRERRPLWLLAAATGAVTELAVTQPRWAWGSPKWYHHTRRGVFLIYRSGMTSALNAGRSGGYLIRDGAPRWLIKGYLHGVSVSPDGCRIAVMHAANLRADLSGPHHRRTLKVISLCQGGPGNDDGTGASSARSRGAAGL